MLKIVRNWSKICPTLSRSFRRRKAWSHELSSHIATTMKLNSLWLSWIISVTRYRKILSKKVKMAKAKDNPSNPQVVQVLRMNQKDLRLKKGTSPPSWRLREINPTTQWAL